MLPILTQLIEYVMRLTITRNPSFDLLSSIWFFNLDPRLILPAKSTAAAEKTISLGNHPNLEIRQLMIREKITRHL